MKKFCSLLLVLCLIFSLSACGGNDSATDNATGGFCAECGEEVSATDKFCSSCGASVDESTSTETTDNSTTNTTQNNDNASSGEKEVPSSTTSKPTTTTKPETSKPSTSAHIHSYSGATCTAPAKCFCGDVKGTALGHKWNSPSCGQLKECVVCGFTEGTEIEHDYVTTISKEATCSEEGEKNIKCKKCNHEYTESIEQLAHNYVKGRCKDCKEFQEFYINGSEKFLDEVLGVEFYYIGIEDGYWIKLRVENNNDVPVVINTDNGSINGNKFVTTVLYNEIAPKDTAEVSLFPGNLFYNYYDSINSVEFNFVVSRKFVSTDTFKISEKTVELYPYE